MAFFDFVVPSSLKVGRHPVFLSKQCVRVRSLKILHVYGFYIYAIFNMSVCVLVWLKVLVETVQRMQQEQVIEVTATVEN